MSPHHYNYHLDTAASCFGIISDGELDTCKSRTAIYILYISLVGIVNGKFLSRVEMVAAPNYAMPGVLAGMFLFRKYLKIRHITTPRGRSITVQGLIPASIQKLLQQSRNMSKIEKNKTYVYRHPGIYFAPQYFVPGRIALYRDPYTRHLDE